MTPNLSRAWVAAALATLTIAGCGSTSGSLVPPPTGPGTTSAPFRDATLELAVGQKLSVPGASAKQEGCALSPDVQIQSAGGSVTITVTASGDYAVLVFDQAGNWVELHLHATAGKGQPDGFAARHSGPPPNPCVPQPAPT